MKPHARLAVLFLLTLSGCAQLVIKPDDNYAEVTAKVFTRFVLGVCSFGISEFEIAEKRDVIEAEHELAEYRNDLKELVSAGQISDATARDMWNVRVSEVNERLKMNQRQRAQLAGALAGALKETSDRMERERLQNSPVYCTSQQVTQTTYSTYCHK